MAIIFELFVLSAFKDRESRILDDLLFSLKEMTYCTNAYAISFIGYIFNNFSKILKNRRSTYKTQY